MATQPDPSQVEFEAQVEALKRKYLGGLPDRRASLADAWHACSDGGDESGWSRLREVAHKLAGSAPYYGLDEVGLAARELDRLLSGRSASGARTRVPAMVERVLAALDAVIGTP